MTHSIIIPHRSRNRNLALCIWSIQRSAQACGIDDYDIVVVDNGSPVPPEPSEHVSVIIDTSPMPIAFNKPYLQNIGIERAAGDALTFLDADAIVGPRWMEGIARLDDPTLTKLCYRVRYIPDRWGDTLTAVVNRGMLVDDWFDKYDTYVLPEGKATLAHEGYGRPEHNVPYPPGPIFGNSQFSIRRDVLGETRYNEEYVGRGFEDLWMIRELWMRNPDAYRAEIVTDAAHAMFHIQNTLGGADWFEAGLNACNSRKYHGSWGRMKRLLPLDRGWRRKRKVA